MPNSQRVRMRAVKVSGHTKVPTMDIALRVFVAVVLVVLLLPDCKASQPPDKWF